jgi:uncharacterized protein YbaR (Trm112 family)
MLPPSRRSATKCSPSSVSKVAVVDLDPALLEILACPNCRADLRVDDAAGELVCTGCGYAYPVRDNIPVLLVDEARRPDAQPSG